MKKLDKRINKNIPLNYNNNKKNPETEFFGNSHEYKMREESHENTIEVTELFFFFVKSIAYSILAGG